MRLLIKISEYGRYGENSKLAKQARDGLKNKINVVFEAQEKEVITNRQNRHHNEEVKALNFRVNENPEIAFQY